MMTIPVFTGCLVTARPIGLFHLLDRGAAVEKVLAVPTGDPYSDGLNYLADMNWKNTTSTMMAMNTSASTTPRLSIDSSTVLTSK